MNKKLVSYMLLTLFLMLFFYNSREYLSDSYNSFYTRYIEASLKSQMVLEDVNEDIKTLYNPSIDENDSTWKYEDEEFYQVDLTDFLKQNEETVAWLKVEGTNIDNVVVQGINNEYYLTHSFNKSKNKAGWIFSDYRNNLNDLKANSIIYAHGRKDKTMFGTLQDVLEESWFNNSKPLIYLSTTNYNYIWQIFSVYKIPNETYYLKNYFLNEKSYQEFLDNIKSRSYFDFQTSVNTNDKILTLSTCKDLVNRVVVHAKLIKKGTK